MDDDKFEKKYKKDDEIELKIKLKKYIVFPGSKIEGTIELIPKKNIIFNNNEQKILFKLTQFLKYECINKDNFGKIEENSDSKEKLIIDKSTVKYFSNNVLNKNMNIEFNLILPAEEQKEFYPTFEFRKKDICLFVRHLLTIEIPDLKTSNSTGVIICKLPEKGNDDITKDTNISKEEYIKAFKIMNKGKLTYQLSIKQFSFSFDEEIPIIFNINSSDLIDLEIKTIEFVLQKKLSVKGFLDFKFFNKKEERIIMNSRKYEGDIIKKKKLKFAGKLKLNEIPEFTEKEILRYTKFDKNFIERDDQRMILNPSINTDLFSCEYKIKVNIKFDSYLKREISFGLVIDLYNMKPSFIDDYLKHIFIIKENPSFDNDLEETQNKKEDKYKTSEENKDNDFVIIDNKDFPLPLNGKDNTNGKPEK